MSRVLHSVNSLKGTQQTASVPARTSGTTRAPYGPIRAWRSSIGLKIAMALTGLVFIGYVVAHLYGNLKIYEGQEAFDSYAHSLRTLGEPILPYAGFLTAARTFLVLSLVVHVTSAVTLWRRARRARPAGYAARPKRTSSISARSMRWGGLTLLAYIIFHLANLTTLTIKTYPDSESPYQRVIHTFQPTHWWVVAIYLIAQLPLGLHMHHGIFSAAQSLGFTGTARRRTFVRNTGLALGVIVPIGFSSIPIAILLGLGG